MAPSLFGGKKLEDWKKELQKEPQKKFKERANAGFWMYKPRGQKGRPTGKVLAVTRDGSIRPKMTGKKKKPKKEPCAVAIRPRPQQVAMWDIQQVYEYIGSLPGGKAVAELFQTHEIDGQALLLITEDHLVRTMDLKLGPALKLCAHIKALEKDEEAKGSSNTRQPISHSFNM